MGCGWVCRSREAALRQECRRSGRGEAPVLLDGGHETGGAAGGAEEEGAGDEVGDGGFAGFLEVVGEHAFDAADEGGVGGEGGDFEIETEGAVVEICGADGNVDVGEEDLLMEEALRETEEADAGGDGGLVEGEGGEVDEKVVGLLGKEDADIDSAQGGGLEGGEDAIVGDEVGRGDPEAFVGEAGGLDDEELPGVVGIGGAGGHDLEALVGGAGEGLGGYFGDVVGGPEPVLEKDELDGLHGGTAEAEVGVTPSAEAFASAEVFVADIQSAHEGFAAVDDDDLAVVAKVQLEARPPVAVGAEGAGLDAGLLHFAQVGLGEFVGTELVEEEVDAHAFPCPFDEGVLEAGADPVAFDDEEIDEDVAVGLRDGAEEGVEGGFAVDEDLDLVAVDLGEAAQFLGSLHEGG